MCEIFIYTLYIIDILPRIAKIPRREIVLFGKSRKKNRSTLRYQFSGYSWILAILSLLRGEYSSTTQAFQYSTLLYSQHFQNTLLYSSTEFQYSWWILPQTQPEQRFQFVLRYRMLIFYRLIYSKAVCFPWSWEYSIKKHGVPGLNIWLCSALRKS